MSWKARDLLGFLIGITALTCGNLASGQGQLGSGHQAAERLWASFREKYQENSLTPLDPQVLDEKARIVLIRVAGPRFASWKPDAAKNLPELAQAISAQDPSVGEFARIEKTLETLLPQIDTYGIYNPAADVAQLREALRQNSGVVHMTLEEQPQGGVLCFPMIGGPAEAAGINPGALLLEVDGRPTTGKSLLSLRLAFVGPPASSVKVKVKQPQGITEEFQIKRSDVPIRYVTVTKSIGGLTVSIRKFNQDGAASLKQQLEPFPKPGNITLDLRGNSGGLRDEALKVLSLFFPQGATLGKFTTNAGLQAPLDGNAVLVEPETIRVLQDGRTASAAELLIATLKEGLPGKVTTFGSKTYGKSHTVRQIPLEGGGDLTVTESLMSTPAGFSWDKIGLEPDQPAK